MRKSAKFVMGILAPAFVLAGLVASPAIAQQRGKDMQRQIVGTWRVTKFESLHLESNQIGHPFGKKPIGYIVYSPGGHFVGFASAGNLPRPASLPYTDAERAAIHKRLFNAYAGTYSIEGNKVTQHVVASFRPENIGTTSIRYIEIIGNKLALKSAPIIGNRNGKKIVITSTYERVE